MKIGIIGGGSIGLLFAYYLSDQYEVTLYTNTYEQAMAINQNGIQLTKNGINELRYVHSKPFEKWSGDEDLTFIAVKQYHLDSIVKKILEYQKSNTDFVFLQNGMGHLKYLTLLESNSIYVCSIEHGAFKVNFNTVEHNGIGQTKIAIYQGDNGLPNSLFSLPGFPVVLENDYLEMLLTKLVANAIINPLTAILKVVNGNIIHNEYFFRVARSLFMEIETVLHLENGDRYFQNVIEICSKTSFNRSSMLKDLEANNPTEIDAILGYILEEAKKKNIEVPICQSLYFCIKGSEKRFD